MISQLINLSKPDVFILHKEKYRLDINIFEGLYGIEIRGINKDIVKKFVESNKSAANGIYCSDSEIFLTGSIPQLKNNIDSINGEATVSLKNEFKESLDNFENYSNQSYTFGNKNLNLNKVHIMGVLNVTPDSFADGGNYFNVKSAVRHGLEMIDQGADIIDIGGESTRPGSEPVAAREELERVIPVIKEIREANEDAIISIDTTKAKVAEQALKCGSQIVNDISGGTFEPEIFNVADEMNSGFVIMHMKGRPKTMQRNTDYENLVREVYDFFATQSVKAQSAGIDKIFLDPGIGFGKSVEDNFNLLNRLDDFKSLSFPLLIGLSRKSFIGKSLNLEINQRDEATNALNLLAMDRGARIIRAHNVKLGVQICRLMNEKINL